MITSKILITDHFYGDITLEVLKYPPDRQSLSHKPVKNGKKVWIGDSVCILSGVTLGDNVVVRANSVVKHSFEKNSVVAGCPTRLIRIL